MVKSAEYMRDYRARKKAEEAANKGPIDKEFSRLQNRMNKAADAYKDADDKRQKAWDARVDEIRGTPYSSIEDRVHQIQDAPEVRKAIRALRKAEERVQKASADLTEYLASKVAGSDNYRMKKDSNGFSAAIMNETGTKGDIRDAYRLRMTPGNYSLDYGFDQYGRGYHWTDEYSAPASHGHEARQAFLDKLMADRDSGRFTRKR